jgi:hypothetical protein
MGRSLFSADEMDARDDARRDGWPARPGELGGGGQRGEWRDVVLVGSGPAGAGRPPTISLRRAEPRHHVRRAEIDSLMADVDERPLPLARGGAVK